MDPWTDRQTHPQVVRGRFWKAAASFNGMIKLFVAKRKGMNLSVGQLVPYAFMAISTQMIEKHKTSIYVYA